MDYEKKYKEALQRAKHALDCDKNGLANTDKPLIMSMFPELKESEDERIRKELLKHCINRRDGKQVYVDASDYRRWADWLFRQGVEKQGKREYTLKSSNHEDVLKFTEYIERRAKAYELNLPNRSYDIYAFAKDILCYLEKQGEQRTTNEVEPEFKVGDWITNGDYTWEILEVNPLSYMLQAQDGTIIDDAIFYDVDNQFHYFTSKDAKDGDVLVDKDNNIGIFQECLGLCWHSYFYLGYDGQLYGLNIGGIHEQINTNARPATKEQCDLLFKKIKEAGYEWDAKNKKLHKVCNY